MSKVLFEQLIKSADSYTLKQLAKKSAGWYKDRVLKLMKNKFNKGEFVRRGGNRQSLVEIGRLYLFEYDAKYKETLPIWDRFPLVIPFAAVKGGFVGVNLHYLPTKLRVELLARLVEISGDQSVSENSKIKISWSLLESFTKIDIAKYATHRYLISNMRSSFRMIEYDDYGNACMLPVQHFVGKDSSLVSKFRKQF